MRRAYDESEHTRLAKATPQPELDFASTGNLTPSTLVATIRCAPLPPWAERWASFTDAQRDAQRSRWEEQLRPVALELAAVAAGDGITASDLISRGITDGILNGERSFLKANPRVYAFVGHLLASMARAHALAPLMVTLTNGGTMQVRRRSERAVSKGNFGWVYVLPQYARQVAA